MAVVEKHRQQPWLVPVMLGLAWFAVVLLFFLSLWLIGRGLNPESGSRSQLAITEIQSAISEPMSSDDREGLRNGIRSLLKDQRLGLLYIRVKRADGRPLALAGRFERWTTPVLSSPGVRGWLYGVLSADRNLELTLGDRRTGSVSYGLAWFASGTDDGFSQWAGALGLVLTVPLWIWLSIRLALSLSSKLKVTPSNKSRVREKRVLVENGDVEVADYWGALGIALIAVNREARVIRVNLAAEKMLRQKSAQMVGARLSACLYLLGKNGQTWIPPVPVVFSGHSIEENGFALVNQANKSQQQVDVYLWPVRDKKNAVVGAVLGLKGVVAESAAIASLRSQVSFSDVALNAIDKAVLGVTKRGTIGYCNDTAVKLLGRSENDVRSLTLDSLFPADINANRNVSSVLAGTQAMLRKADGADLSVGIKVRDLPDTSDFVLVLEETAVPAASLSEKILQQTEELFLVVDAQSQSITSLSQKIVNELGYSKEKIISKTVIDLFTDLNLERLQGYLHQLQSGHSKSVSFEATLKNLSGGEVLMDCEMVLGDNQGTREFLIALKPQEQVIHENKPSEEDRDRLVFLAYYDSLTSLPSRLLFMDRLQQAMRTAERTDKTLCVATLSIAGVTQVNRQLGVSVGDQLLKSIALRLQKKLCSDDLLSRVGSSFVMALMVDEAVVDTHKLRNILEVASAAVRMEPASVHLDFCLGYALFPVNSKDPEQILLQAFKAANLAASKSSVVGYDPALIEEEEGSLDESQMLGLAIGQNRFTLQYSPITRAGPECVQAVMVNLDWSEISELPQEDQHFSALVQRSGLAADLALWIVREACGTARSWSDAGMVALPLVLDLSLLEPFLEETVSRAFAIMDEYQLGAENFIVAVSADALHENSRWLSRFREAGCRVWLRLFGQNGRATFDQDQAPHFADFAVEAVANLPNDDKQVEQTKRMLAVLKQHDCEISVPGEISTEAQTYLNSLGCDRFLESESAEVSARQLGLRLARSEIEPL